MPCRRLAALVCAVGTTLVATCGPSAAPTSTGSSPSGAAQPPAAGAASQGTGAAAPAGASADWDRVVAAAKQEASAVLLGPTSEAWRKTVTEGFYNRFGIPLEYVGIPTTENVARHEREAAAGKVSFDADLSGGDILFAAYRDILEPVKPNLIMPGVADPQNWKDNQLKWVDPEQQYLLRTTD